MLGEVDLIRHRVFVRKFPNAMMFCFLNLHGWRVCIYYYEQHTVFPFTIRNLIVTKSYNPDHKVGVEMGVISLGTYMHVTHLRYFHCCMITSSNGNIFRVTGPLCGEFTGTGEFPSQRPVTWSLDIFFDPRLNKWLNKQSRRRWFETPPCSSWRHCNAVRRQTHQQGRNRRVADHRYHRTYFV